MFDILLMYTLMFFDIQSTHLFIYWWNLIDLPLNQSNENNYKKQFYTHTHHHHHPETYYRLKVVDVVFSSSKFKDGNCKWKLNHNNLKNET